MKLHASAAGFDSVFRKLRGQGRKAARAASASAAGVLAEAIEQSKNGHGISAPLIRETSEDHHLIGATAPEAIDRELGTLTNEPTPWLAPVLPAARGPMRAAAASAAVRAISSRKGKS